MRNLFAVLIVSLFIASCAEDRIALPDLQDVRSRHDRVIDSLKQQLSQSPLNRKLLVEFGKACLFKSRFESELSWTGEWGTLAHPKLAEAPLVAALPVIESALHVDTTSADLYAIFGRIKLQLWRIKQTTSYDSKRSPLKDKAAKAYSRALVLDSLHANAIIDLARLVLLDPWGVSQPGERAKAEELAQKAIQLDPENGMLYLRYGQILASIYRWPRTAESDETYRNATKAYRKAILLGVDEAGAYLAMADFFEGTGTSSDFDSFNKTFAFVPGFIKGFFLAGLGVMEMSGREKAGRLIYKALQLNPVYPAALMALSSSFEAQGRREKAVEYFLKATQINPAVRGPYLFNFNARSFLEEVISKDPESYSAYALLGELHLNRIDQSSISYIKKALEIRPDFAQGWILLGRAYQKQYLIAEADTAYQKALSLPLDHTLNLYWAMDFYREQKKFEKAVAIVERQIAEGLTDSSWGFRSLGQMFEEQGQLDRAISYYTRATKSLDLREPVAYIFASSLAQVYVKKKNFAQAILTLQKILSLTPLAKSLESEIYGEMGGVYSAQGNSRRAIEFFEHALELGPDIAVRHYVLGKELLKLRQKAKALEHFQRAAELGNTAAGDSVHSLKRK